MISRFALFAFCELSKRIYNKDSMNRFMYFFFRFNDPSTFMDMLLWLLKNDYIDYSLKVCGFSLDSKCLSERMSACEKA